MLWLTIMPPPPDIEDPSIFFSLSFLRICLPLNLSSCLSAKVSGQISADDNGSLNLRWASGSSRAYTDDPHWGSSLRLGKIGSTVPRRQGLPPVLLAVLSARSLRVPSLQKISIISRQAYDLVCHTTEIHSGSAAPAKVKYGFLSNILVLPCTRNAF